MQAAKEAVALYKKLADKALISVERQPTQHKSLFQPDEQTEHWYQELYLNQWDSQPPKRRPGGPMCTYCANFHLGPGKPKIAKDADIKKANEQTEGCFQEFLNEELASRGVAAKCERNDHNPQQADHMHRPDFVVVRQSDGRALLYIEQKSIFKPFIWIASIVNPSFECYANSLTLDLSNGNKLAAQRYIVENELGVDKTVYAYWYDLPCVKGVFWLPSSRVYEIMDEQEPTAYDRRAVAGDYGAGNWKRGATKKLYLPLLQMNDLTSLLDNLTTLAQEV